MAADDERTIEAIRARVAALPSGDYHAVVGSGFNWMTAVSCEVVAPDGESAVNLFLADALPDYMDDDEAAWDSLPARTAFLLNAVDDVRYLLGVIDGMRGVRR
jgi:hypothetical protein